MAVLLTGGTGFLGTRLLANLLARGLRVVALVRQNESGPADDRLSRRLAATGLRLSETAALTVVEGDITETRFGLSARRYDSLASEIDTIWHCAALVRLQGEPAILHRINVTGTANVLRFAEASGASMQHISTAFVAGTREGVVREDELLDDHGFATPYEQSKHEGERLVRKWAAGGARAVTVYRPSVLVTDQDNRPPAAPHTVQQLGLLCAQLICALGDRALPITLRVPAEPLGHLNLLPVEYAAEMMIDGWMTSPGSGSPVPTWHVTHPTDTPFSLVAEAFGQVLPIVWSLVDRVPDPSWYELLAQQQLKGFLPYVRRRRRFDPGVLGGGPRRPPQIDRDYLVRSLRRAGIGTRPVATSHHAT